jgi:hypothetical protein
MKHPEGSMAAKFAALRKAFEALLVAVLEELNRGLEWLNRKFER